MSNVIILSEASKIKTIEYSLGTQYGTSHQSICFGTTPVPESVKNRMDFLAHSIFSSLEGRVPPAKVSSSSEIPEGANLFEEADLRQKALAERASFVSCADAERVSDLISERLQMQVVVRKRRNPEQDRIARQAQLDAHSEAFAQRFAHAFSKAIAVALGEHVSDEESSEEETLVSQSAASSSSSSSAPVELTEDEKFIVTHLEIRAIEAFTRVVEILNQEGFISKADTQALSCHPIIKQIEEQIAFRKTLSHGLSQDQRHAMKHFFEAFVTPIIERCIELDTPEKLLGNVSWENLSGPVITRDIAFAALVHCAAQGYTTVLGEKFEGLSALYEPAKMLSDIFNGTTGMEGLLKEQGLAVPSLELQRSVLFEYFEEQLDKRFGPEDVSRIPAEFNPALVNELRKQLFVDGYYLNMIERKDFSEIPMVYHADGSFGYAFTPPMTINTFSGTILGLQGKFLSCNWFLVDRKYIDENEAVDRFALIRAKAEARLIPSEPASSSQ